jgi:hypothetical protein
MSKNGNVIKTSFTTNLLMQTHEIVGNRNGQSQEFKLISSTQAEVNLQQ